MTSSTELRFTDEAVDDLHSILQYTIETWGLAQGEAYRELLRESFERLRLFPEAGRPSHSSPYIRELTETVMPELLARARSDALQRRPVRDDVMY